MAHEETHLAAVVPPAPAAARIPAAPPRDAGIDALRGLAALLVLFHHLFAPLDWSAHAGLAALARLAKWTWLGVPIFFVVSGRCVGQLWLRPASPGAFLLRRARRIYPPYLASLLVCLGAILVRKLAAGTNDVSALPRTFSGFVATLTLATAPATTVPTINWVYWSLTYEIAFYVLLAALLFFRGARRWSWLPAHALLSLLDVAGLGRSGTPLFFVDQWALFALGVGVALFAAGQPGARPSLAISALHLGLLAALGRFGPQHLVGLAAAGALLGSSRWRQPLFGPVLPWCGLISYSLYLVHVPVGVHLLLLPLARQLGPGPAGLTLALTLAGAGTLAAAAAFHRLAERPWLSRRAENLPAAQLA